MRQTVAMVFLFASVGISCRFHGDAIASQPSEDQLTLAGSIEVARLLDIAATRLGVNVQYDADALRGAVTLRLSDTVSDEELWTIATQALAARGFVVVAPATGSTPGAAGTSGPPTLVVSKMTDAAGVARLESIHAATTGDGGSRSGPVRFISVVTRVTNHPPSQIIEALKPILSKTGGTAQSLGASGLVLISDLQPRVDQALDVLAALDAIDDEPVVERVRIDHLAISTLITTATQVAVARDGLGPSPGRGTLIADPAGSAALIVAPESEVESWRRLIEQIDRESERVTRTYASAHFSPVEVARLLEATLTSDAGGTPQLKLIVDELTGSIVATASARDHERIVEAINRLDAAPLAARRVMRSWPIRHRDAAELAMVLRRLVDSGAADIGEGSVASSDEPAVLRGPGSLQRTDRPAASQPERFADSSSSRDDPGGGGAPSSSASPSSPLIDDPKTSSPSLTMTVDEGTNSIIAIGAPRSLDQIEDLLERLDVRQPQVMVESLVISLSDAETFDLGVELEKFEVSGSTLISLSSLFGLSSSNGAGRTVGDAAGGSAVILNPGDFSVVVRALETLNDGRSLSRPRVLVANHQQATLDSVLQQPFTTVNASDTVATTAFGGFENAGTTVTVTPRITRGDHLRLEYAIALSSFVGESSDPSIPPPRQQSQLQSVAEIPDGFVIAVGGLEVESQAKAVSQVPLLGSIPIVGEAFKSRSKSQSRSRFFVFIRPTILRHATFEDLKYLSGLDLRAAEVDADGDTPSLEPRIIR